MLKFTISIFGSVFTNVLLNKLLNYGRKTN